MVRLMLLPGLVVGLTLHEFAHAWSASLLGDDFARRRGRVSLNPFRHLSLLGTLAILVLPLGWAKPVPINLYNFRKPRRDYLISSLAGPLANLVVAAGCVGLMQISKRSFLFGASGRETMGLIHFFLQSTMIINIILAVLNLLPIPPLDGSRIWSWIIPGLKPTAGGKLTWVFIIALLMVAWAGGFEPVGAVTVDLASKLAPQTDARKLDRLMAKGIELYEADRLDESQAAFEKAVEINPASVIGRFWRARLRSARGDWQGTLVDVNVAIDQAGRPSADMYTLRAEALENLGKPEQADEDRQRANQLRLEEAREHFRQLKSLSQPASQ